MNIIIDNVGFPRSLAELSEREFVEIHLPNDAIAKGKTEAQRKEYLKTAYSLVKKTVKGDAKPRE